MEEKKLQESPPPANRLCSEIQLFDLCDLDSCGHKNGRFCTNEELLARFEAISEEDDRTSPVYDEDELEDDDFELDEYEEYGDANGNEGYDEDE